MTKKTSPCRLLSLAAGTLPLVSAAACPFAHGSVARDVSSDSSVKPDLQARAHSGDTLGRCARKSKLAGGGTRSSDWWPCDLSIEVLRQFSEKANPYGPDFDYPTEFAKLNVDELKKDFAALQTDSQSWWPADFGNYGPFFVRLAWHNAGTYRSIDGRGGAGMGQQRFAPLNSWPDNASLDKARRLLWPLKQKYGEQLSWADLFVFAGNQAMENMGFPTYGFGFGREDTWQSDEGIYWGSETAFFGNPGSHTERYNGNNDIYTRADRLETPLASTDMGLIYVNPEGPSGSSDPKASALDIRETFTRMGMDDEETVAVIAGGHAFGKTHGAVNGTYIGPEPMAAPIELQGLGWKNSFGTGTGVNAYTSGLEVIWTPNPTKWSNEYFNSLFGNNWTKAPSPAAGHVQWEAVDGPSIYPDPFIANKTRKPTMLTSDIAFLHDESFLNISKTFHNDFDYFTKTFARAWFKLIHRDMGPISRYLGPDVPKAKPFIWQDPLPAVNCAHIDEADIASLKHQILAAPGLNISNLVTTAWGSASTFRMSDKRGGANGARIALEPQRSFPANNPERLNAVLKSLRGVQESFNHANGDKQVSLADLIVLGGNAAIEKAAHDAGISIKVPFTVGRVDATQEDTDVESMRYFQQMADGFRNYGHGTTRTLTEEFLIDKAAQLSLSPPELTVLIGGMRALGANYDGSDLGIFTDRPQQLTNDFFVNLLDANTKWSAVTGSNDELFEGRDLESGKVKYAATRADLIFGSHPELRAVAEVYGTRTSSRRFVDDFIRAWAKVMDLDRFDVRIKKATY
ncbi:bifunctional catalase-peroxidase cat2 [Xylaria nigripes]|nr:bifunctional catalase-peroxidase cat2 [Xylaria nigripes]